MKNTHTPKLGMENPIGTRAGADAHESRKGNGGGAVSPRQSSVTVSLRCRRRPTFPSPPRRPGTPSPPARREGEHESTRRWIRVGEPSSVAAPALPHPSDLAASALAALLPRPSPSGACLRWDPIFFGNRKAQARGVGLFHRWAMWAWNTKQVSKWAIRPTL